MNTYRALILIARTIKAHSRPAARDDSGTIRDENGNTVGQWEFCK